MNLFKFFKSTPNNKSLPIVRPKKKVLSSYEKLKKETERLKNENHKWQIEFDKILILRNKATKLEKSGNYSEATKLYLKCIQYGTQSARLGINNYSHDINRIIILYGKTKERSNQKLFLQNVIKAYPNYRDVKKWKVRLLKLIDGN